MNSLDTSICNGPAIRGNRAEPYHIYSACHKPVRDYLNAPSIDTPGSSPASRADMLAKVSSLPGYSCPSVKKESPVPGETRYKVQAFPVPFDWKETLPAWTAPLLPHDIPAVSGEPLRDKTGAGNQNKILVK